VPENRTHFRVTTGGESGAAFESLLAMGRTAAAEATRTLEQGSITFFYRPRVEEQHPEELHDVQRLLLLLSPEGSAFERAIAIGRKRLPGSARRDRFWGFVDLVLTSYDMHAALGAFANGTYDITSHGDHSHLRWRVEQFAGDDPVAREVEIEDEADYIVTIANPDPTAWGLLETPNLQADLFDDLELHVTIPTPFPPALQQRFRDRRFTQLDTTDWLDHPGAEIVFVGAGE
jgi:hypothetical protein